MKKYLVAVFIISASILPSSAFSANINLGANLWYAWFEPSFENEFKGDNENQSYDRHFKMTEPSAVVYGGLLGVQFTGRVSLGAVFSYGSGYECAGNYKYYNTDLSAYCHMSRYMENGKRFESDVTINYAVNSIFRVFCGLKYLGERGDGAWSGYVLLSPSTTFSGPFKAKIDSAGPGAGISSTVNLIGNLYLIATGSGIYMRSREVSEVSGDADWTRKENENFFGGNAAASLAYAVPGSGVTILTGSRYQYLKDFDNGAENKFYGFLASAIYSFSI